MAASMLNRGPGSVHYLDLAFNAASLPSSLGTAGDLAVVTLMESSVDPASKKMLWHKTGAGWQFLASLPSGNPYMAPSVVASGNGVGSVSLPGFTAIASGGITITASTNPWTKIRADGTAAWTTVSSRFAMTGAGSTFAHCGVIKAQQYTIPPSPLMVVSAKVNTKPTETTGVCGIGIYSTAFDYSLMCWTDKDGYLHMGQTAMGTFQGSEAVSSAAGVVANNNYLVLVRNGPLFTACAFNAVTGVLKAPALQLALEPAGLFGAWSANPGIAIADSTATRMSGFTALA